MNNSINATAHQTLLLGSVFLWLAFFSSCDKYENYRYEKERNRSIGIAKNIYDGTWTLIAPSVRELTEIQKDYLGATAPPSLIVIDIQDQNSLFAKFDASSSNHPMRTLEIDSFSNSQKDPFHVIGTSLALKLPTQASGDIALLIATDNLRAGHVPVAEYRKVPDRGQSLPDR